MSIIIINYNTFCLTCDCIRSIKRSSPNDLDIEIILIDNGSTEICERSFTDLFPDIVYVRSEVNLGFSKGNNLGTQHATKEYLLFLNSDTVVTSSETLSRSIEIQKAFNDKVVLTCRLLTEGGKTQISYGYLPGLLMELLLSTFFYKLLPARKRKDLLVYFDPDSNRVISNGYITATYYLFPRKLLELLPDVKLYDNIFLYGEELFWATQWKRSGIAMYYASDISVVHLVGRSSKKDKDSTRVRRMYQLKGEHAYLQWRYNVMTVGVIYFLRMARFAVLAPFDRDIRMRLRLMCEIFLKRS